MEQLFTSHIETPIGLIEIKAGERNILSVLFKDDVRVSSGNPNDVSENAKQQLKEYFAEKRKEFDLPLHLSGSGFQNKVWQQLQTIKYGKAISYLQLALDLGDEKCIRAAASANGKNPFAIIVPCHRVIGKDGSLTGYAGGLWRKQWLLEHEGVMQKQASLF